MPTPSNSADITDAGLGVIARKAVWAITGGRLPTVEDYHAALVQCLRHKADEIERLRLTDAEREAVERAISREMDAEWYGGPEPERVTTLRRLLERMK